MAKNVLATQYEKRGVVWHLLWVCKKSGNVIHETPLVSEQESHKRREGR